MDITDVEGDREGGVRTLPVLLGRDTALALAAALLTVGVGAAGAGIVEGESHRRRRCQSSGCCRCVALRFFFACVGVWGM